MLAEADIVLEPLRTKDVAVAKWGVFRDDIEFKGGAQFPRAAQWRATVKIREALSWIETKLFRNAPERQDFIFTASLVGLKSFTRCSMSSRKRIIRNSA